MGRKYVKLLNLMWYCGIAAISAGWYCIWYNFILILFIPKVTVWGQRGFYPKYVESWSSAHFVSFALGKRIGVVQGHPQWNWYETNYIMCQIEIA